MAGALEKRSACLLAGRARGTAAAGYDSDGYWVTNVLSGDEERWPHERQDICQPRPHGVIYLVRGSPGAETQAAGEAIPGQAPPRPALPPEAPPLKERRGLSLIDHERFVPLLIPHH